MYFSLSFLSNWTSAVSGMQKQSLISKRHLYLEIQSKKQRSAELNLIARHMKGDWSRACVYHTATLLGSSEAPPPSIRHWGRELRAPRKGSCPSGSSVTQLTWSSPAQPSHLCSLPWLRWWHCSSGALSSVSILSPELYLCKGGVSGLPPRLTEQQVSYSKHNL